MLSLTEQVTEMPTNPRATVVDGEIPADVRHLTGEKSTVGRIATLVAIACVLQISESMIPHPIPGVRLGLANMITLVALVQLGFKSALEISILRTVVSSLVMGTFLTPTFLMSFGGAITSTAVMGIFYAASVRLNRYGFSLVGISILGAVVHNITQIIVAYYLLIKHPSLFYFIPWLMLSGVVMGWLTALVAREVCARLRGQPSQAGLPNHLSDNTQITPSFAGLNGVVSALPRVRPEWKILFTLALSLVILFLTQAWVYPVIALGLTGIMVLARLPLKSYLTTLSRFRQMALFVLIAFSFPILFSAGRPLQADILADFGPLKITEQGLNTGGLFALRILLLVWVTVLLSIFTTPEEMTVGIRRILAPFRIFGLSGNRVASIITLSWTALPGFWQRSRTAIRQQFGPERRTAEGQKAGRIRKIRELIPALAGLITVLYQEGGEGNQK